MNLKNIDLKKIFAFKSFSVLIIPDNTNQNAKTLRFSNSKTMALVFTYSLIMALLGFIVLSMTPLKGLFSKNSDFSNNELKSINELNERIIKLSNELNEIRNSDEKLKKAIKLGDSSIFNKENAAGRSEEHTSELQSLRHLVCRLL